MKKSWKFIVRYRGQWLYKFYLKGTTYSGHPTVTTLGNTLRVYSYNCYYLSKCFKKFNWFDDHRAKIYVQGDDSVIHTHTQLVSRIKDSIFETSSIDKSKRVVGLGQCIKEVIVRQIGDIDFLSKSQIKVGDKWKYTRNLKKALVGSTYYIGEHINFVKNPREHSWIIGDQLRRETLSDPLFKALQRQRTIMGKLPKNMIRYNNSLQYKQLLGKYKIKNSEYKSVIKQVARILGISVVRYYHILNQLQEGRLNIEIG